MIVEGGSSAHVVDFLKSSGVDFVDYGDAVAASDVPARLLGTISELPDVRVVWEERPPVPATGFLSPKQSSTEEPEFQGVVSQTLTEAPMWHAAKAWHKADSPLRGDGLRVATPSTDAVFYSSGCGTWTRADNWTSSRIQMRSNQGLLILTKPETLTPQLRLFVECRGSETPDPLVRRRNIARWLHAKDRLLVSN